MRIEIIADDYGIAPGVDRAIRSLARAGRLTGTSVMTVGATFDPAGVAALEEVREAQPGFAAGLHVTLTGRFRPLAERSLAGAEGMFGSLGSLAAAIATRRIDAAALRGEIEAQVHAFERAFRRPPTHVDGHRHVHLIPGVSEAFVDVVSREAPFAWVRQCGAERPLASLPADPKAGALSLASRLFVRRARAKGLRLNPSFAGVYDFAPSSDFAALLPGFLDRLGEGGCLMVHPGFVDADLEACDPLTTPREREFEVLSGDDFARLLAERGITAGGGH